MIRKLMDFVRGHLIVISFFTRLPVGKLIVYEPSLYVKGLYTFPLMGIVVGAFLYLPEWVLGAGNEHLGLFRVLFYVLITGGIHLDGLADACDGLFSGRKGERILEIMKDSHIGTFGVVGLILFFLVFYHFVSDLDFTWVVMMPIVGRTVAYWVASFSKYARNDHGMGYLFINEAQNWLATVYVIVLGVGAFMILGLEGVIAFGVSVMIALFTALHIKREIGGQTGDTIGLIIELSQMMFIMIGGII